ncbi:efflux RND transporter periplasmic adaptor subunit [Hyphomonas sp. FCG-A18]|uniref:efflux RND transporter periplasmic adaptor subunit n=1 Tax=Hyphomonas sp. FCG-A18 TaxID=3080019 RepID=UPI002B2B1F54|nr:efflux RND transporter periplasmic adaptor subunit [Hyphomonas sp. FCG-A18]
MPSLPKSVRTAGFILLALLAYFIIRGVTRSSAEDVQVPKANASATAEAAKPEVIVTRAQPKPHQVIATLKGRTEADREITVRSETIGTVTNARVNEGMVVKTGALLCGLDVESRAARIAEAEASVEAARLDYEASMQLEEKGWTTSNRAAATKATLDRAEAALATARIELRKTRIVAPFDGVFEARLAEHGDFLSVGAPCGRLVDLDPIIIVVEATEAQMGALNADMPVQVTLATGAEAEGTIRFVARTASPQTRTFRIEVQVDNPDGAIAAGLTASVDIGLGQAPAVLLTPASLVLHDDGRVGVRYVDNDDVVQFAEVTVIDDASDGVWVTGLPGDVNLLVAGQDYLREGVEVTSLPTQDQQP